MGRVGVVLCVSVTVAMVHTVGSLDSVQEV